MPANRLKMRTISLILVNSKCVIQIETKDNVEDIGRYGYRSEPYFT